ncbi:MAG: hypothetical protein MJY94_08190 [Bacteroidales bacterium]|nr:hypothetical protein [Bacteroidales bacterium]
MRNTGNLLLVLAMLAFGFSASAQSQGGVAEDDVKKMLENVDHQVEQMTRDLDLEDWQVFYVDSILTANYLSLQAGFADLSAKKVSNRDIYQDLQYSKLDEIYYALEKVFDESQWAKYLKRGAAKDKKSREKYFAKKNK